MAEEMNFFKEFVCHVGLFSFHAVVNFAVLYYFNPPLHHYTASYWRSITACTHAMLK
jgi:hypothetical protein